MTIGTLTAEPAANHPELLAPPVAHAIAAWTGEVPVGEIGVAAIDPALADTAEFCARYDVGLDVSANCVVLACRRDGRRWFAGVVVLATTRADVNGAVKRALGASKISFAPMDEAVAASGMEYGGITPIGLPADWPILVDQRVVDAGRVIVGSGIRASKISVPGPGLAALPGATVGAFA